MLNSRHFFARAVLAVLVVFFLITPIAFQAQSSTQEHELGLVEFFTIHTNKKRLARDSTAYPAKLILAPIVSFRSETSLAFGTGAKYLFKLKGSGDETRTSNMPMAAQYTLKNQFILKSGFEIFAPEEKWMLTGNFQFQSFPRSYFGIGDNTPESGEVLYDYDQLLIEPILLKRAFARYLFLGAGIRYNHVNNVEFDEGDQLSDDLNITGAYGSQVVGVELAAVYDSRNNLLNATDGCYFEFTYGIYDDRAGSSHSFNLTRFDFRYYWTLSKKRRDVIAVQFIGHFADKSAPLAEMAYFGSPEIMRGYYEGRYIDYTMLAFQTEYRRPLWGRFGAVVFAGIGNVQPNLHDYNIADIDYSVGLGVRFLLDKRENLNLRFDWGFGEGSNNYYFNIAEAF